MGGEMPWTILLFASGSLAIPAPSIFLVPPYPSSQEDPIYISCTAPEDFLGANFTLFRGEEVVQLLQAPSHRPGVTFNVTGGGSGDGGKAPGGNFHCQYSVIGEHSQPQLSGLSQPVQVSFPVKVRNLQKQRERESCWAQINFTNTERLARIWKILEEDAGTPTPFAELILGMETVGKDQTKKMTQEDLVATLDAHPCNSGPRKRPTSASSSPEPLEFSTFRACQ
ncbi:protein HIDE1 isoform X3 [Meriones unguiculatus]|uniref:protein HIDE1 isoform X3 n=1 Tax=Meriones unguiculatus TaxID=10047 RepID=UPI00293E9E9C|nr:protein HIDE1 isoform X3 [Meriones unguiculatus]